MLDTQAVQLASRTQWRTRTSARATAAGAARLQASAPAGVVFGTGVDAGGEPVLRPTGVTARNVWVVNAAIAAAFPDAQRQPLALEAGQADAGQDDADVDADAGEAAAAACINRSARSPCRGRRPAGDSTSSGARGSRRRTRSPPTPTGASTSPSAPPPWPRSRMRSDSPCCCRCSPGARVSQTIVDVVPPRRVAAGFPATLTYGGGGWWVSRRPTRPPSETRPLLRRSRASPKKKTDLV